MKWLLLNSELERILKETIMTWFELPSRHILGRIGETETLRKIGVIGKTWTGYLSERSQKHYSWANFPVALPCGIHEWFLLQVTQLEDFFGSEDVFFAYGNERYSREDFDLDVEGKESYILIKWWARCGPTTFTMRPWFDFRNAKWTSVIFIKELFYLLSYKNIIHKYSMLFIMWRANISLSWLGSCTQKAVHHCATVY